MKHTRFLRCSLLVVLLFKTTLIYGQELKSDDPARVANRPPDGVLTQLPKLSPGAQEVAREIGVTPLIEQLYGLPERDRGARSAMSLTALSLRQEITEVVLGTSLEVDGIIAEIDSELAQMSAIRADLETRRDRAIGINTIANIVAGGVTGVVGTALQFKNSTANLGNGIGVAGAGVSTFLSLIGLRQQHGGQKALGVAPNLLAKLFDKKPEFHSDYPEEVWTYLNAVPPAEPGTETRRALLIKRWTELGRIESTETAKGNRKIELLTSSVSQQRSLTIDLLTDRAAMLEDVRAQVSLMKRDLSKLMLALRSQQSEEKK
jgi:hypothetical protein